jgi:hypothetical protein
LRALAGARAAARSGWQPRLERASESAPAATERPAERTRGRWLAPAALIAVCATLLALTIGALSDSGGGHAVSAARAPRRAHPAPRTAAPAPASPAAAATPVSAALAAQLEARGHELLEGSEVAAAVPVLQRALVATGESLSGCVEPVSETCLDYAYALYDLGRALRLDHQPAAAVLILERRLRIANQHSTVQSELALARQEAGQRAALTAASG